MMSFLAVRILWKFHFERVIEPVGRNSFLSVSDRAIGLPVGLSEIRFGETTKVVLESRSTNRKHETKEHDSFFLNQCSFDHFPFSPTSLWIPGRPNCSKMRTISLGG